MKRIIMNLIIGLALVLTPAFSLVGGTAYAACSSGSNTAKDQVLSGIGETSQQACDDSGVQTAISTAVNILSIVVGIAAVLMVLFSGFKYITSGGETGKVANAKSSLIYALIGLVVAALAQFMVHFVINQSTSAACPPHSKDPACQAPTH